LTDFKVKLDGPGTRSKYLVKQFQAADILSKWNKTAWARKRAARAAKSALGDFDRYKLYRYQTKVFTTSYFCFF
jgi:hypothetical protein